MPDLSTTRAYFKHSPIKNKYIFQLLHTLPYFQRLLLISFNIYWHSLCPLSENSALILVYLHTFNLKFYAMQKAKKYLIHFFLSNRIHYRLFLDFS